MSVLGQSLNLLSSILAILLTCPNNNTLLCYSNEPFLTVKKLYLISEQCLPGGESWADGVTPGLGCTPGVVDMPTSRVTTASLIASMTLKV